MRIFLDATWTRAGGGWRLSSSLLQTIVAGDGLGHEWIVALPSERESTAARLRLNATVRSIVIRKPGIIGSCLWLTVKFPSLVKRFHCDVAIVPFGVAPIRSSAPVVVGSAYGNLYYPEVKFWTGSLALRLRRRVRDKFRRYFTARADAVFVETDEIRDRAHAVLGFPFSRLGVVRPARPEVAVRPAPPSIPCQTDRPRILAPASWNPNKGLWILPNVASELRRNSRLEFDPIFNVTSAPEAPEASVLRSNFEAAGCGHMLHFVGEVDPSEMVAIAQESNAVLLLSKLESFSNTVLEAWASSRPLVVSDETWSRAICGGAAIYATRSDPADISDAIVDSLTDATLTRSSIEQGYVELAKYPTAIERAQAIVRFAESIIRPCPPSK